MSRAAATTVFVVTGLAACSDDPTRPADPPGGAAVASIEVTPAQPELLAGDTLRLSVVARDAAGRVIPDATVSWSVSDSAVAVVDANGWLHGRGHGPATVAARAGTVSSSATVSVRLTTEERRFAYALADGAAAAVVTEHNATGGTATIHRSARGVYTVAFERMAKVDPEFRETVVVTAVGSQGERCQAAEWHDAANQRDLEVSVECSNSDGLPADARFSILIVGSRSLPEAMAFARVAAPAAGGADGAYTFSHAAEPVAVTRSLPGSYRVVFSPPSGAPRHYLASTVGSAPASCKVASWNAAGSAGVLCHAGDGALSDAGFSLLMLERGRNGKRFAFAWAQDPAIAVGGSYTPALAHQRSSSGAAARVSHLATGVFRVEFPGVAGGAGALETVHVGSYGGGLFSCQVERWDAGGADASLEVLVRCWSRATARPADTYFTVLVLE